MRLKNLVLGILLMVLALGVLFYRFAGEVKEPERIVIDGDTSKPWFLKEDTPRRYNAEKIPQLWPEEPVDSLAEWGREIFLTRGCSVCHSVGEGERLGPDLKCLHRRRDFKNSALVILNPDSMLSGTTDRYPVEMPNQRLTYEEAEAVLHFLLKESRGCP